MEVPFLLRVSTLLKVEDAVHVNKDYIHKFTKRISPVEMNASENVSARETSQPLLENVLFSRRYLVRFIERISAQQSEHHFLNAKYVRCLLPYLLLITLLQEMNIF